MTVPAAEWKRKTVHVGSGLFAFFLPFLTWPAAAAAAAAAFLFNFLALPRLGGAALHREGEAGRRHSTGIVLYPLVVLALVLLFRERLEIVAVGWAFLAFGDGGATLAGLAFGGPRLPWNPKKSVVGSIAFVLAGASTGVVLFGLVRRAPASPEEALAVFLAASIGAAVESLPSELDDNLLPPLVGAGALSVLLATIPGWRLLAEPAWLGNAALGAAANLVVAGAAGGLRIVRPSGVAAGFVLGTFVWAFGGAPAYALLWIFFAAGTLATRFGRKRKEAMGKAEKAGGRRGAANVLANVTVAAFFIAAGALAPAPSAVFRVAATAAFATALMDTIGTEVGQAVRSATVLLPDFRRAAPGTDGAVSVAGTLAGLLGALLLAGSAQAMGWIAPAGVAVAALAAVAGTVVESLLGRAGASWRVSNGHVLNFVNTLAGAGVALLLGRPGGLR